MTTADRLTEPANLPAIYSEARNALAKCARIDECKGWADRAAALASYAKQADDEQLLNNAKRIKARAIDRIGELAEEIPPAKGGRPYHEDTRGDAPPSRVRAARDAGISADQLKTALRVHNVPRDEFERQVESDNPPTITELARQGTKSRGQEMLNAANQMVTDTSVAIFGALQNRMFDEGIMDSIKAARYHLEDAIRAAEKFKPRMSAAQATAAAKALSAISNLVLVAAEELKVRSDAA
jgi:hypothetical protein